MIIKKAIIFVFLIIGFAASHAQNQLYRFNRINTQDGLSHSTTFSILNDKIGYLYFGTYDGFNRFDGYKIKKYFPLPRNPKSAGGRMIRDIQLDRTGFLWIVFEEGVISRFDPWREEFLNIQISKKDSKYINGNIVNFMYLDTVGNVYVGTDLSFNKIDANTGKFTQIFNNSQTQFKGKSFTCMAIDENRTIWLGTTDGLIQYKEKNKTVNIIKADSKNPDAISNNTIHRLYFDHAGNLWVSTAQQPNRISAYELSSRNPGFKKFLTKINVPDPADALNINFAFESKKGDIWFGSKSGLFRLKKHEIEADNAQGFFNFNFNGNKTRYEFTDILEDSNGDIWTGCSENSLGLCQFDYLLDNFFQHTHDQSDPASLSGSIIQCLYEDFSGNLWIGTLKSGINRLNLHQKAFSYLGSVQEDDNSLTHPDIYGIFQDRESRIWIGTLNGLNCFDPTQNNMTRFYQQKDGKNGLPSRIVGSINQDKKGNIWLGFYDGQISSFEPKTMKFTHYQHKSDDPLSLKRWSYRELHIDDQGIIWAGASDGLVRFDPEKKEYKYYSHSESPTSLSDDFIWTIYESTYDPNILWIGTMRGGLNKFDKKTGKAIRYQPDNNDKFSISQSTVHGILQSDENTLWVGTSSGLNKLDINKGTFTVISMQDGLPGDNVHGILPDKGGYIWISTNNGLCKYHPEKNTFRSYYKKDGLQGSDFNEKAYFLAKDGQLFFGGANGLTSFYPQNIKDDPILPAVVITDLKILNKSVKLGDTVNGRVILTQPIGQTKKMKLTYREYLISFEFAALHYTNPEQNLFKYKLEGFEDKEWFTTDATNRRASFTSLPAGNYVFKLIACNSDGNWNNEGISLNIEITPPWWETWAFRIFAGVLILAGIFVFYKYRTYQMKKRNRELEKTVSERTYEIMQQNEEIQQQSEELSAMNEELAAQAEAVLTSNKQLINQKEELEKSFRHTKIISEFGQKVTAVLTLESINQVVHGYVSSLVDVASFGVGIFKKEEEALEYIAYLEGGVLMPHFMLKTDNTESLAVYCFNNQKVIHINDLEIEYVKYVDKIPDFRTPERPQSLVYLPLTFNKKRIGVFQVGSLKKNGYSKKDLVNMHALASYITISIDNAAAYNELKKAIAKLQELDKFKESLTGMIVHDLKNPLNAIIGLSSLDIENNEAMAVINSAGNQMLNLVLNILDVQKFEEAKVKLSIDAYNLKDTGTDCIQQVALLLTGKKLKSANLIPETITPKFDYDIILRVFINLLTNAIKYTPADGCITLNAFILESARDNHLIQNKVEFIHYPQVIVSVTDTGIGIPEDKIQIVFEKFGQVEAKKSGTVRSTGLGLTFCKLAVEAHKGKIWVTSTVNVGTTFWFSLPA